jgi:hypothetical protein
MTVEFHEDINLAAFVAQTDLDGYRPGQPIQNPNEQIEMGTGQALIFTAQPKPKRNRYSTLTRKPTFFSARNVSEPWMCSSINNMRGQPIQM